MRERLMVVVRRHAAELALVIVTHEAVIKAATGATTISVASWHRLVDG